MYSNKSRIRIKEIVADFHSYYRSALRILCSLDTFPFQIGLNYQVAQHTLYSYLRKSVWFTVVDL